MNRNIDSTVTNAKDWLIWLIIAILVVSGIFANQYYSGYAISLRVIGWMFLIMVSLGLVLLTQKGKRLKLFAQDARIELRKVVWPTKPETVRTTMIVFVMVIVVGLFLWLADALFLWAISKITV